MMAKGLLIFGTQGIVAVGLPKCGVRLVGCFVYGDVGGVKAQRLRFVDLDVPVGDVRLHL